MLSKLQRGIISITSWVILGLGAVVVVEGIAVKVQTSRLEAKTAEYDKYKGGVEALGHAAEVANAKTELAGVKNKERTDEETVRVAARGASDARRLRDDVARGGVVPEAGPAAQGADGTVTYDRKEHAAALQRFVAGTSELAIEGGEAEDKLTLAKSWALSRPPQ